MAFIDITIIHRFVKHLTISSQCSKSEVVLGTQKKPHKYYYYFHFIDDETGTLRRVTQTVIGFESGQLKPITCSE